MLKLELLNGIKMNEFKLIVIVLLLPSFGFSQIPDFSDLSGRETDFSSLVKTDSGYAVYSSLATDGLKYMIYSLTEDGTIRDSIDLREALGNTYLGSIKFINGKLYFGGFVTIDDSDNDQHYCLIELSESLAVENLYNSEPLDTLLSPFFAGSWTDGTYSQLFDFTVHNDTLYAIGAYVLFSRDLQIIGFGIRYFKSDMNNENVVNEPLLSGGMFGAFFDENKMYYLGSNSNPAEPWLPTVFGEYNNNGRFVQGWNFDNSASGEFPWGSCGGLIDDRFYFSYAGRDPQLAGCSEQNVAIDVRDKDFNIIKRFKIEECDYRFAGDLPFAKTNDGSIFFHAAHESNKKIIVQKYNPDMNLIWSQEFNFEANPKFLIPTAIVPTEDNGVLIHLRETLNSEDNIRLLKISSNGDIVSSLIEHEVNRSEKLKLFPNPTSNELTIEGLIEEAWVEIYNLNGTLVERKRLGNNTLDVGHLNSGMYIVHIKTATINETHRLIKIE